MVDRRYIISGLGALIGAAAGEAMARPRKKKGMGKHAATRSKHGKASRSTHGRHHAREAVHQEAEAVVREPVAPPPPAETSPEAAAALKAAFDGILNGVYKAEPSTLTSLGLDKGEWAYQKARLDDRSLSGRAATQARLQAAVTALKGVDRNQLAGMDRINYDTVLWDFSAQLSVFQNPYGDYGNFSGGFPAPYVVSQLSGSYQFMPDFLDSQHTIATKDDADAYMARLNAFAKAVDDETQWARADMGRGVVAPDFILKAAIKQLTGLRDVDPAQSTLINSLVTRCTAANIPGTWQADATAVVTGPLKDALSRQIDLLTGALPRARHEAGVRGLPDGDAYYALCARVGTSTDMAPRDVHALGLDVVARLTDETDRRLRAQGLTQGSVGQRLRGLYTDPRFIYPNTDDGKAKLLSDLNAKVEAVETKMPRYFGVLPKTRVVIKRVPVATEAGAPGGYYNAGSLDGTRPGAYYINLRDTADQPSWLLPTLTYHESVPGHHLQGSIANETQGLPTLRKLSYFNAYIEGWALYAEQLAGEMGMYDNDPWGYIGYLHDALFRGVRLVVDTGIHALGWSREQAIAYMVDVCGDTEDAARSEIERYCAWPGQALGYMIGKLTWLKIRDEAKARQGAAFDIKAFHDTGLLCGAVPLSVLENVYKDKGMI
jgi:uncharacterized protein (DUF885 family)